MWQNSYEGKNMFSSVIEMEFKTGMMKNAIEIAEKCAQNFLTSVATNL